MGFSRWKVIAATVTGLLLAAACGGSSNTASTGPTKVQVAFEFMFTPSNVPGDAMLKAAQLYIKQFNDKGGIKGTKVDLVVWDDQGKGTIAQTLQAQGISDPTGLGLICCQFSSVTLASEPGLQGATPPLPFVAIGASNPKVTDSGYSVAHRINARDDLQGPADAKFIVDKGAKRVEILYPNIDYGTALAGQVEKYIKTNGSGIETQRDTEQVGQRDFSTIITHIKAFKPDWIFSASLSEEASPFLKQLKDAGYTIGQNINYLGSDGHFGTDVNKNSQYSEDGAFVSTILPDPSNLPAAASFKTAFTAAYPDLAGQGVYWGGSVQALQIMLQAINASPVNNGKISRADVLSHLNSDTFNTIVGSVQFDSKGDIKNSGVFIYQVQHDNLNYLKTVSL
jgi:branched-chain amino acid transport system substrate-binding protein